MSYQSVIRHSDGQLVSESPVAIRISILQGSASGPAVYVEEHHPVTNINGLASIKIGEGSLISGDYSTIDWSGPHFVQTETDPNDGTDYFLISTSELLAVPYALYAVDVENKDDADADPTNEIELPPGGQDGQLLRIIGGVPKWVFPDNEAPSVPTGLSFDNMTSTSLDLSWNPSLDSTVVIYRVLQTGPLVEEEHFSGITDTNYQATDLIPMRSYEFAVQAYDVDGNTSIFSDSLYVDRQPPSQVPLVFFGGTNPSLTTLTVFWDPALDDVAVVEYEIFQDSVFIGTEPESGFLNFPVTGLEPYTSYEFAVRAVDMAGNVGLPTYTYVDRQLPTVPDSFAVSFTPPSTLSFSWSESQDDSGIDEYRIEDLNGSFGPWIFPATSTSWEIAYPNDSFSDEFRIQAEDSTGLVGPWSEWVYLDLEAPSSPSTSLISSTASGCPVFFEKYTFSHSASTDDVAVVSYQLFSNGVPVTSSPNVITYVSPCLPAEPIVCTRAFDAAGNVSNCD